MEYEALKAKGLTFCSYFLRKEDQNVTAPDTKASFEQSLPLHPSSGSLATQNEQIDQPISGIELGSVDFLSPQTGSNPDLVQLSKLEGRTSLDAEFAPGKNIGKGARLVRQLTEGGSSRPSAHSRESLFSRQKPRSVLLQAFWNEIDRLNIEDREVVIGLVPEERVKQRAELGDRLLHICAQLRLSRMTAYIALNLVTIHLRNPSPARSDSVLWEALILAAKIEEGGSRKLFALAEAVGNADSIDEQGFLARVYPFPLITLAGVFHSLQNAWDAFVLDRESLCDAAEGVLPLFRDKNEFSYLLYRISLDALDRVAMQPHHAVSAEQALAGALQATMQGFVRTVCFSRRGASAEMEQLLLLFLQSGGLPHGEELHSFWEVHGLSFEKPFILCTPDNNDCATYEEFLSLQTHPAVR